MKRSTNSPLLFLPIETKVREYHAKLLFSILAVDKGFDVLLGGQRNLRNIVHRFGRGIYLDKSIASTKRKWVKWCQRLGHVPVAWDEEGLVYFSDDVYHELRVSKDVLDQMQIFFTWGQAQCDTICGKYPGQSNLVVSGNPRFDLLKPEYRNFYLPEAQKLNEKYGSIILINTNFGLGNHYNGAETERKRLRRYPIDSSRPDFFDGWIDMQQETAGYFVDMIPALRKRFPDHTIIVRPHPSESHEIWNQAIKGLDGCIVTGERNVLEWILASDVLIHTNCTTAVEAFLMDVRAILYQPCPLQEYAQELPNGVSLEATSLDQLLEMVDTVVLEGFSGEKYESNDDNAKRFAKRFIANYGHDLASENILDILLKNQPVSGSITNISALFGRGLRSVWLLAQTLKQGFKGHTAYDEQKFPGLTLDEIDEDLVKFQSAANTGFDVRVEQIYKDCFYLCRKEG